MNTVQPRVSHIQILTCNRTALSLVSTLSFVRLQLRVSGDSVRNTGGYRIGGGWWVEVGICLACGQIWTSPAHHPGCALYHAPPPRRATADSTCARLWGYGASPVRRRWLLANRSASQTQRRRAWGLEDANDQGVVYPGGDTTQPLREVCRAPLLSA